MSNCNAGVCDCLRPSVRYAMESHFSASLYFTRAASPTSGAREREIAIRIYMLGTFIYTALYAGKPVRLTINHTPFPSTAHAPPCFKILLSLIGYSVMILYARSRANRFLVLPPYRKGKILPRGCARRSRSCRKWRTKGSCLRTFIRRKSNYTRKIAMRDNANTRRDQQRHDTNG